MASRVLRLIDAVMNSPKATKYTARRAIMTAEEFAAEADHRPVEHFFDHYLDTPCHDLLANGCFLVHREYDNGRDGGYTLIIHNVRVRGKDDITDLLTEDIHKVFSCCIVSMRTARIHLTDGSVADAISWVGFTSGSYVICTGNDDSLYIHGREQAPRKI